MFDQSGSGKEADSGEQMKGGGAMRDTPAQVQMILDRARFASAQVREALSLLADDRAQQAPEDLLLGATELVNNAIQHTSGFVHVSAWLSDAGRWRVEVDDESKELPTLRTPTNDPPGSGGYGLHIVNAVATAAGVEPMTSGKRCWLEVEPGG